MRIAGSSARRSDWPARERRAGDRRVGGLVNARSLSSPQLDSFLFYVPDLFAGRAALDEDIIGGEWLVSRRISVAAQGDRGDEPCEQF
jgi:hypothetical protein